MIDPSSFLCADHQFLRFRPSILAAVCLAVARRQARIEPLWPARLERKTGFSLAEIADCFNFTWRYVLHLGSLSYPACCPQNSCLPALGVRIQHARECTGEAGGNGTRGNGDVSDLATLRWAYDEEEAAASKKRRDDETKKNDKKKRRKERTRQEKERRRKRQVYHTR